MVNGQQHLSIFLLASLTREAKTSYGDLRTLKKIAKSFLHDHVNKIGYTSATAMLMKMEAQPLSSDEREATSVWKNLASEYATMYEPWPRQEKFCIRPPSNGEFIYNTNAVYDMKTMYDESYIPHPQSVRTKWVPPKNNHRPIQEPMNCKSTYDECYKRKTGQRPPSFKPNPADHQFSTDGNDCQKVSVNQQTYRAYTKPEFLGALRKPIIIEQDSGIMPTAGKDLALITTVQETFRRPSSHSRRQPIIPETNTIPTKSTMELLTTHRADFTPKGAPSAETPVPALLQDKLSNRLKIPHGQTFNICSTFQNDYITHAGVSRPKSFKPLQQYQPSETPFDHETLYDYDFRAKQLEGIRPMPWKPDGNLKVSAAKGPFQDTTQYRDIHCQKNVRYERPILAKPKTSVHERSMPFFDATSYNSNYRRFGEELVERRQNFKPVRKYQPPNIAFTAESTAHAHYRGDPAPPSKICKPVTNKRLDETVIPLHQNLEKTAC